MISDDTTIPDTLQSSIDWVHIPVEITREIFLQCSMETVTQPLGTALGDTKSTFCVPSIRGSPLQLAHVCGTWRAIALNTPHLWTSLGISNYRRSAELAQEICTMWLGYSGNLPLDLSISVDDHAFGREDYPWADEDDGLEKRAALGGSILESILPYFSRWSKVHLRFPILFIPSIPSTPPAYLTELMLGIWLVPTDDTSNQARLDVHEMFTHANKLKILTLGVLSNRNFGFGLTSLPWSSIEHLHLNHEVRQQTIYDILTWCPNLRSLRCSIFAPIDSSGLWRPSQLVHPLTSLHLSFIPFAAQSDLALDALDWLRLPALTHLVIERATRVLLPVVKILVSHSGCILTHLFISGRRMLAKITLNMIVASPGVQTLIIRSFLDDLGESRRFTSIISARLSTGQLRCVRYLWIGLTDVNKDTEDEVLTLARSCNVPYRLKACYVQSKILPAIEPEFLKETGIVQVRSLERAFQGWNLEEIARICHSKRR